MLSSPPYCDVFEMAIFLPQDYVDAFEKLLKLQLNDVQDREIVHVLVDCCLQVHTGATLRVLVLTFLFVRKGSLTLTMPSLGRSCVNLKEVTKLAWAPLGMYYMAWAPLGM